MVTYSHLSQPFSALPKDFVSIKSVVLLLWITALNDLHVWVLSSVASVMVSLWMACMWIMNRRLILIGWKQLTHLYTILLFDISLERLQCLHILILIPCMIDVWFTRRFWSTTFVAYLFKIQCTHLVAGAPIFPIVLKKKYNLIYILHAHPFEFKTCIGKPPLFCPCCSFSKSLPSIIENFFCAALYATATVSWRVYLFSPRPLISSHKKTWASHLVLRINMRLQWPNRSQ